MNHPNDNQDHDPLDEQIDFALSVLNVASPPDGMEARILRLARKPHSSVPWLVRGAPWSFAAAACCAAIALGVALVRHNNAIKDDEAAHLFTPQFVSVPPATAHPVRGAQKALPHDIPNGSSRQKLILIAAAESRRAIVRLASPQSQDTAYVEMLAPSKPAPEMPLTQQERLLLSVAHRRNLNNQVADLRRPIWPLHDPDQDDNFEQFFQRPPALHEDGVSE